MPGDGDPDIVTAQAWDDSSRLISRTDDNGNETVYEYDPLGRMTAEVFADCTQTVYEYDVHHNATTISDANGSVITCEYDVLNRLTDKGIVPGPGVADATNGGTTFETFAYDGLYRLVRATDDDSEVQFLYDSLSNVTQDVQGFKENPGVSFDYRDTTATFDGESNMLTCKYPGGRTIGCTYDVLDRKATISDVTDPADPKTIASYLYVGRHRVAQRDYGNDTRMTYAYDGLANLPDDFGVRQVIGTTHTRIDPVAGTVLETRDDRTYTWDRMFNKTQRKDVRAGGPMLTHDYTYDRTYRLTDTLVTDSATATVRDTNYNLDGVHNRLSVTGTPGPATGSYTMNAVACNNLGNPLIPAVGADRELNQYTTTPLGGRNYDANGNLTRVLENTGSGGNRIISCLYDYRNRMVEYRDTATFLRHTYAYDALGRRIAKTDDAGGVAGEPARTRYFYGGESHWQVCEEQIPDTDPPFTADATIATYVYGRYIDEVIQMQRCEDGAFPPCDGVSPVDYYYHTDDMYNVMAVTDAAGNVVERYDYDDYGPPTFMDAAGNVLIQPDGTPLTSSAIANPYLFTGRRYDPESGWYNYRTRYLDPKSGKFTTRDVIGIWGDPREFGNGYAYVGNRPSSLLDPSGLGGVQPPFMPLPKQFSNEKCAKMLQEIINISNSLYRDIRSYDPNDDPGGKCFGPKKDPTGKKRTKPGGHRQSLEDRQRNLRKKVDEYNKHCYFGPPPIPEKVWRTLEEPVPAPIPTGENNRITGKDVAKGVAITGAVVGTAIVIKKIVGAVLILIPEPATSAAGLVLVATP